MWPFSKKTKDVEVTTEDSIHPLISLILDLVSSGEDPWSFHTNGSGSDDPSWFFLTRTASDKLYLSDCGALFLSLKIKDTWISNKINLTRAEKRLTSKAYDDILRNRASKILEYRSPEIKVDESDTVHD